MADEPVIFLSHSSKDSGLATKVGMIVWATGAAPWQDKLSLQPGVVWRAEITKNVEGCNRMFVLWCRHSKSSKEVEIEYDYAIVNGKPVVPVLLDCSRLVPKLKQFEVLDLRWLMWWSHAVARWERVPLLIGILLLIAAAFYAR